MILQALHAYAVREGLGGSDFEKRPIDYQVVISSEGRFLGLVALATRKHRAESNDLPIGPASKNNPGYPSFVVDNAMYVLGTPKSGGDTLKKMENAAKCRASYRDLIAQAAEESKDAGLAALQAFVSDEAEVRKADAALEEADGKPEKRGDRVLVPVLESEGSPVHARPSVRQWWETRRRGERRAAAAGPIGRCLVTGELGPMARIHPTVKGPPFPGTGAKLVAYDKDAYASHHLDKGANASVSESAAQRYVAALNHLIEREGDRRRSAILLDEDTVVAFWTRDAHPAPALLLSLFDPVAKGADAVEVAQDVWRGVRAKTFDPTPFYAVTLSANSARVVVRDWIETTAVTVKLNLDRWFDDLQLGEGEAQPLPLVPTLRALQATPAARRDKRGVPPRLATLLFRAAVQGSPLPLWLMSAALDRVRLPPSTKDDLGTAKFKLRARFGIIKAVLRRLGRKDISVSLDVTNESVPYLLGRLFAVLERLQAAAHGRERDINATIRDRYFGAASRTPAVVFGRLIELSHHHQKKLAASKKGLSVTLEKELGAIISRLPPEKLPSALQLEEQGLFAIGYYHQREAFFSHRGTPARANGDGESSPETSDRQTT